MHDRRILVNHVSDLQRFLHSCHDFWAGLHPKIPLFQRIAVMQVVKQLLGDGYLVYFLFASFDMQPVRIACKAAVISESLIIEW